MTENQDQPLQHWAEINNSLSTYNRVYTFHQLQQNTPAKKIAQNLDITRNAIQHYIDDWKQLNLLETTENGYQLTEKGTQLHNQLKTINNY